MPPGDDDTVRPDRTVLPQRRSHKATLLLAGLVVLVLVGGGIEYWLLRTPQIVASVVPPGSPPNTVAPQTVAPPAVTPGVAVPQPPPAVAPAIPIRPGDEATIRANLSTDIDVFRFTPNPLILVIDFATLRRQGTMLNRIAAMSEKAKLPHDHPLTDAELDQAIRAGGDTPENFYYGHDYGTTEITRFFAAADQERLVLTPEEEWLRMLLRQEGFFEPGSRHAVITIPTIGAASDIDLNTRSAILHHELSHGEFFSSPAYAAWTLKFWHETLTDGERAGFKAFLVSQNYDPNLEDLLANETQAYLMFTPDIRLFAPAMAGLNDTQAARLRQLFRDGMPAGWLRDSLDRGME